MIRRYLAHWPDEVSRVFHMLDLIGHGPDGHGPVHLLLTSDAEIGFAWGRGGEMLDSCCPLSAWDAFAVYPTFPERYF